MADIVSIELLLDPECEARIRAEWESLERAGLSSLGAHRSPTNRPHITLLARPSLARISFSRAIARLPIRVTLGAPIVFTHEGPQSKRGVLVRPVEPSDELVRLHRIVHEEAQAGTNAAHTAPGEWTPHVTLARRLRLDQLPEALTLLEGTHSSGTHSDSAVSIRRWDSAAATVTDLV